VRRDRDDVAPSPARLVRLPAHAGRRFIRKSPARQGPAERGEGNDCKPAAVPLRCVAFPSDPDGHFGVIGAAYRRLVEAVVRKRLEQRLSRRLRKAGIQSDGVLIRFAQDGPVHRLELERRGRSLAITADASIAADEEMADTFLHRAPALVDPFLRSRVAKATGDFSDGEESGAGIVSFCATDPGAVLVPDALFHASRGYASDRAATETFRVDWSARRDTIVWRGSTTGHGRIASRDMRPDNGELMQRTRLCLALKAVPDTDARFATLIQSTEPERDRRRLAGAGLAGGHVDPMTWLVRKFAIDIDGNSNAWSNLFTRLIAGCCVIKVASPLGYRQWYYGELEPGRHFVPVRADLSDLAERIEWCRVHDRECAQIAGEGRRFALAREFEGEMARAGQTLDRRLLES